MDNKDHRLPAYQRGYDHRWHKLRAMKLRHNPLCEQCQVAGYIVPAHMVHHIKPITSKDDPLRLSWENLMSLCEACHDAIHAGPNKRLTGCDIQGLPINPDHPWIKKE